MNTPLVQGSDVPCNPRCVVCGKALTKAGILRCLNDKSVPSCFRHHLAAKNEMSLAFPMWPNGWYGHCATRVSGEWYIEDETKRVIPWPI